MNLVFVALLILCICNKVNSIKKQVEPPTLLKISDVNECQSDIERFCPDKKSDNFELLSCLHNNVPDNVELSQSCQHIIWQAKNNLTKVVNLFINGISAQSCEEDIVDIPDCKIEREKDGPVIPCLLDFRNKIKNPTCKKYLDFLKPLIFSDYKLTYKLVSLCSKEIDKLQCGRLTNFMKVGDQGSTIDCLAESFEFLNKPCKNEVLKISELQSDDWKNDRPLFLACREDRERLCSHVVSGSGHVYECLFKNKMNPEMSKKCTEKLRLRQKLQQNDFSINYRFAAACSSDIKLHKCDKSEEDSGDYLHANMSKIILCLEEAKLGGLVVAQYCLAEVKRLRFSMLEDHKINPEVVTQCREEIKSCEDKKGSKQPYVIHCLMKLARKNNVENELDSISSPCFDAVEHLLIKVDIGDDFDVDPALMEDCSYDISLRCSGVAKGEGRVMDCLMSHLNKEIDMNQNCVDRLMEVQYFFSRNFKVSRRLVVQCKQNAKNICSMDLNNMAPSEDSHLISCLYRNLPKVAPKCVEEVQKLMKNRAISIDLPPAVQESCMSDLVNLCSGKLGRDEEMYCLEDNYDKLSLQCKKQVNEQENQEESLTTLGRIFINSCEHFSKEFCGTSNDEDGSEEPPSIMKCLINNKNHPQIPKKCRAGIEHHQLMLMKEVKLSRSFNEFCNIELKDHCPHAVKKLQMVKCLSEHVYNDTMLDVKQRTGFKCKKELSFVLLQIGENIVMDSELKEACKSERELLCKDVKSGNGEVIECLRGHQDKLRTECRELLFRRELMEGVDSSIDYTLITKCKKMIKKYCRDDPTKIFECLKNHRNDEEFDEQCHSVIINRMRLKSEDIRLNPVLFKSCKNDINKHCGSQMEIANKQNLPVEGLVIQCLRMAFVHKLGGELMSSTCKAHISEIIKNSAIDYLQDATLVKACRPVIEQKCLKEAESYKMDENGAKVEDCLREVLLSDEEARDHNLLCFHEVLRRMDENKVDIQIDPILNQLCRAEVKTICRNIRRGEGRMMSCLMDAMPDMSILMNSECRKALHDRSELWSLAVKIAPPENLGELYEHVHSSASKLYFQCILFTSVCIIFLIGLYCGRVTKRSQVHKKK